MTSLLPSLIALAAYIWAAVAVFRTLKAGRDAVCDKRPGVLAGLAGLAAHALALRYILFAEPGGLNLSFSSSAGLVMWLMAAIYLLSMLRRPADSLGLFIWPLAAVAVALEWLVPGTRIFSAQAAPGLRLHVAMSIIAYSLFTIACLQALVLAFAEHRLRHKKPMIIFRFLPPLMSMESFLFELISAGVLFLSIGMVAGFIFVEDILAQHLVHKSVLSLIAWLVFVVLLAGRLALGWRGRIAIRSTIAGFLVLMLAFFGSKFVLEVLLDKV